MFAVAESVRWLGRTCLLVLACATGITPGVAARGQDCKLSVQASPQVLYGGQSANVNVFAHFPTPPAPGGAYAFASSTFDVHASDPMWTWASAGAVAGNDVLGITAGQAHSPQTGINATPLNPFRVWRGTLAPQSNAPAMIEIAADPTNFSVYPSVLTSSSAPRDAEGGSDFIFANPLRVGRRWLAAPADGTSIQVQDDVIVDGQIITGPNWNSVSVGIVPTGSVRFYDSSMHVALSDEPVSFTATVQAQDAQRSRVTSLTVTFDSAVSQGDHQPYLLGANFILGDGSVRNVRFDGFVGGVFVASGDLDQGGNGEIPGLVVSSIPQNFGAKAGPGVYRSQDGGATWTLSYDQPVMAVVRGPHGLPQTVTLDRIVIHGIREAAARISSSNNLKQMSLGCHVFTAEGVQQMTVTPRQGA